jgi:ATP-dependent RNA helicase RhlE
VWRALEHKGFRDVTYIHSDLPQDQRELAVAEFKSGKYRIIVATDVMGRGIDVDDVAHVVNYDVPRDPADYIHRIGRTGRRGQSGHASTFAVPGLDDKSIEAIARLRGVEAPKKDAPAPRREERSRHPKSHKNPRPQANRSERPARPAKPVVPQAPQTPEVVKTIGFMGWVKKVVKKLLPQTK